MPVYELYSRRIRESEESEPDVFQYDHAPESFRTQIVHIWNDAIGTYEVPQAYTSSYPSNNNDGWTFIRERLCREKGVFALAGSDQPKDDCVRYLLREKNINQWLDIVEVTFRYINKVVRRLQSRVEARRHGITQKADDAIDELNTRFRYAGLGYQFENNNVIRVDSQIIHNEVIKPALVLLSDPRFSVANDEYLEGHQHYRTGKTDAAVI